MEASLGGSFVHANVDLYEKMCEVSSERRYASDTQS